MASDFLREAAVLVFVFNLIEPGIEHGQFPLTRSAVAIGTTFLFWAFGVIVEKKRVPQP